VTFVGVAGLLIALAAALFMRAASSRTRTALFSVLYILHTAASFSYYYYAQSAASDAVLYYYDIYQIYGQESGLGTIFTVNFVQYLREIFGGTFLDYFLLFQSLGLWGLVFVFRIMQEIFAEFGAELPWKVSLLLFLPGLHFWTAALGKDAPLFLGVAMAIWASMQLARRFVVFGAAVLLMLLFRPHIALLAVIALTLSILVDRRTNTFIKAGIIAVVLAGAGTLVAGVESTFSLDVTNQDEVGDFFSREVSEESGADLALVQGSFLVKYLSLLFRPFFYDAEGAMAYIASLENAVILAMVVYILRASGTVYRLAFHVMYARFAVIFFVGLSILLALVNFNIGLGLRQKMMLMPSLLALLASVAALKAAAKKQESSARLTSLREHARSEPLRTGA